MGYLEAGFCAHGQQAITYTLLSLKTINPNMSFYEQKLSANNEESNLNNNTDLKNHYVFSTSHWGQF
jgi:hypothetical protein